MNDWHKKYGKNLAEDSFGNICVASQLEMIVNGGVCNCTKEVKDLNS